MAEKSGLVPKEQFKSFFLEFVKKYGEDLGLAIEKMLPGAIRAFENSKGVKIDLGADEMVELEKLAFGKDEENPSTVVVEEGVVNSDEKALDIPNIKEKEPQLSKQEVELAVEVEELAKKLKEIDNLRIKEWFKSIGALTAQAEKELSADHPLLQEITNMWERADKEFFQIRLEATKAGVVLDDTDTKVTLAEKIRQKVLFAESEAKPQEVKNTSENGETVKSSTERDFFAKIVEFEDELMWTVEDLDEIALADWLERVRNEFEEPYGEFLRQNYKTLGSDYKDSVKQSLQNCLDLLKRRKEQLEKGKTNKEKENIPTTSEDTGSVAEKAAQERVDGVIKELELEELKEQVSLIEEEGREDARERQEKIGQLEARLNDLKKKLADAFIKKEKKSGLFGKLIGGKKQAEEEYARIFDEYDSVKLELVKATEKNLSDAMLFLKEQEKQVRMQIKEKYREEKENVFSKAWRKMGDCNIYNLFEKMAKENPESWWGREFNKWGVAGKVGGKMLSLRFGVSMGLAGFGIHGPGMATQSEVFIWARSGMVGLGSGFGSRSVLDAGGRWLGGRKQGIYESREEIEEKFRGSQEAKDEEKIKGLGGRILEKMKRGAHVVVEHLKTDFKTLEELGNTPQEQYNKLSGLIGEYEGYAFVNKIDTSKSDDYARLLQLREQLEMQLLEKRRDVLGEEDGEKLLGFLNELGADNLEKLSEKIGSAKTKRWIKRGVSITFGTALGVFTKICLTAKAAHEQASQAYFAWVESKQKALEAAQEAQTHAVEPAGVAPPTEVAPPPAPTPVLPQEVSRFPHPPTGVEKATEVAVIAKLALATETPRFDVDLGSEEFKTMASELRLSQAGMDYMEKMTERFPQLKDADVLKKIWRAGELGDHSQFKHEGIYDATRNFDTHIKTAGAFKFEVFQSVLDKAGVDEATEYLKLFKFNEHSLTNLGIDHADKYFVKVLGHWELKPDASLREELFSKMRGVVDNYKSNGSREDGRHIFNALRHHENRFIGDRQLPVKGIEKGVPVRVIGTNEFIDDNQIIVEQAKKGARALHIEKTQPTATAERVLESLRPVDIGVSEDANVKVGGNVPEGVETEKIKVRNIIEITPKGDNQQVAAVVLDDGRVFMADVDVVHNVDGTAVTDVLLNNLQSIAGQDELLQSLANVAKDSDLAEMAKFYPGSSRAELAKNIIGSARGYGYTGGGGTGSGGGGVSRVLITPEVVPAKPAVSGGGGAPIHEVRSAGSTRVSEHTKPRAGKIITPDIEPKEPVTAQKANLSEADQEVAKFFEQPSGTTQEILSGSASFEDVEKVIDEMNWGGNDIKKAKIFVRFLEMQKKLLDNEAGGLRKMLGAIVGDVVNTQSAKDWIDSEVEDISVKQELCFTAIRDGINSNQSFDEIKKKLAEEMFVYDQADRTNVLPDVHNPKNLADYNRYVSAVLQRKFDESNVEMKATLEQTQAVSKHGGAASK